MAQKKFPPFGQLEFGMLDAASEAAHSPELLIGGYYDCKSAAKDISMMRGWVLVGAKGAGKSAVLEHLALQWAGSPMNFISRWALTTFPIADVTKLQVGSTPGPSATCAAWQFQLLLKVFASLIGDQGASYGGQVTTFHRDLVRLGLLEGEDLRTKFFDWSKTTVRFQVQGVGAEGGFGDAGATAVQLIELLKRAISEISTDSQHLLAVDGLDSFFASSDDQWNSFGGLLDATNEVNVFLRGTSLRATVLIAVREDMFTSAESFDSAKMDDQTIRLSWSQDDQAEGESLWGMISQKARVSVRNPNDWLTLGDIRKAYLSEMVNRQLSVADYLLGYTRYLPRDMVALMNAVKRFMEEAVKCGSSRRVVRCEVTPRGTSWRRSRTTSQKPSQVRAAQRPMISLKSSAHLSPHTSLALNLRNRLRVYSHPLKYVSCCASFTAPVQLALSLAGTLSSTPTLATGEPLVVASSTKAGSSCTGL